MSELVVKKLSKTIKNNQIIKEVSLSIKSGEIVGLFGSNGAGKTTTFYMICGLVEKSGGEILLDDKDISIMPLSDRARLGIGYLPQESSILKELSVYDNLRLAAELIYKDKDIIEDKINQKLQMLSIQDRKDRLGKSLSGGERRRAEIARALMIEPKFLLLDEPFAGVDPRSIKEVQGIVGELKNAGIGILITDHNVKDTLKICDKAYVLDAGYILASGTARQIAENDAVKDKYLGKDFIL